VGRNHETLRIDLQTLFTQPRHHDNPTGSRMDNTLSIGISQSF